MCVQKREREGGERERKFMFHDNGLHIIWRLVSYKSVCNHLFPIAPLQIDKLNTELLSERAGHEKHVQELKERHEGEMGTARKGFREEVAKLQREMDQLKEGSVKVRRSVYHRSVKYCLHGSQKLINGA